MPLPRKFMNFSSQNGVIWCILGLLYLRFMCHENDSDLRYSEVPLKEKNKTHVKKTRGKVLS